MPKRSAGRRITFAELRTARLAYQAGDTFDAIAARYGVSESGIRKLLRATGIEARARGIPAATIPPLAISRTCHAIKTRRELGEAGKMAPVKRQGPRVRGCDVHGYPLDPHHPWNKGRLN
jgi:hypothetical protein